MQVLQEGCEVVNKEVADLMSLVIKPLESKICSGGSKFKVYMISKLQHKHM